MGVSVPDSCVTVAHSLDTGKQTEGQKCLGRKMNIKGGSWEETSPVGSKCPIPLPLQVPTITAILVESTGEAAPPHPTMPCFTENGVLFSVAPGLTVLLQGDLTLSSTVTRSERRHEGQQHLNHQLHKKQEHMLLMRALH